MSTHSTLWAIRGADTRRWAFYNVGAFMCPIDTGKPHGPVQWLEAQAPAVPARHESQRLFAPVDVMPGQLTL
jgi:hypothetical protein